MLWVVAGAAAAIWCALVAVLFASSEPRRVTAGPPTLDLPGSEPAAVVVLLTDDWELGRDWLTATVLDLAARRYVAIEWIAPHTFVRVRRHGPDASGLTPYEQQVLDHVRGLADETTDGMVPAEALTTGPRAQSRGWWKRFDRAVTSDARARGLSRPRWSAGMRTVLGGWAIVVGLTVGLAAATLPKNHNDDDPVGTAVALGVVTAAVLVTAAGRLRGERDTPAGREAAARRWLGLREMLADDPTFPVQPPAAVAIWGRLMGYGAAMGLTGAAVDALPMGTESERLAWSPVGNRWRPVRIRYPDVLPPGYGRSPLLVAAIGVALAVLAVVIGPGVVAAGHAVLSAVGDAVATDRTPWWVRLVVGLVVGVVVAGAAVVAVGGLSMLVTGVADLVRPRRTVEGRVLRIRRRGDDDHHYWHIAVDDGATDRVRAWRVDARPDVDQGDTVRAAVSPWLAHVRDLRRVTPAGTGGSAATGEPVDTTAPGDGRTLPALPDAAAVARIGRPVEPAADAAAHPLALGAASATYVTADGGRLLVAWVPPASLDALRALPRAVAPAVTGIGDEAFRAGRWRDAGAFGSRVLLVSAALPGADATARDAAVAAVAGLVAGA